MVHRRGVRGGVGVAVALLAVACGGGVDIAESRAIAFAMADEVEAALPGDVTVDRDEEDGVCLEGGLFGSESGEHGMVTLVVERSSGDTRDLFVETVEALGGDPGDGPSQWSREEEAGGGILVVGRTGSSTRGSRSS